MCGCRWAQRESKLHEMDGFKAFFMCRRDAKDIDDGFNYQSTTIWRDRQAFADWTQSQQFQHAHSQTVKDSNSNGSQPTSNGSGPASNGSSSAQQVQLLLAMWQHSMRPGVVSALGVCSKTQDHTVAIAIRIVYQTACCTCFPLTCPQACSTQLGSSHGNVSA